MPPMCAGQCGQQSAVDQPAGQGQQQPAAASSCGQPCGQKSSASSWLCCSADSTGSTDEVLTKDVKKVFPSAGFDECHETFEERTLDQVREHTREHTTGPDTYENVLDADVDADATTADTMLPPSPLTVKGGGSSSKAEAPTDFGGSWLCVDVTGNMEAFLTDMGLSSVLQEAAKSANYGSGRQVQNIAQVGDTFIIQNILKTPVTMRFQAGGGVQQSVDQEGRPIHINPWWDDEVLCVSSMKENGDPIANTRRFLEGEFMVLELTSPQGNIVQRIFERR